MAKQKAKVTRRESGKSETRSTQLQALRKYVRSRGAKHLDDPNVTSVGIAEKDGEYILRFTVGKKVAPEGLEDLGTELIPRKIQIDGFEVDTDVIERSYRTSHVVLKAPEKDERKKRVDPIRPGVSVSHPSGSAGTLGLIVYDRSTGAPCILSNWHVLNGANGKINDGTVQPGPFDDNRIDQNGCGTLIRSHLGAAGDCAIARIEGRDVDPAVSGLGTTVTKIAEPELGDLVVKSGRTTGVTLGQVRRVDVMAKIPYPGVGEKTIGAFEIGPPPKAKAGYEVSMPGDSGSSWLIAKTKTKKPEASDTMVGLHFAGNTDADQDEHALACYAPSVFEKLDITLTPPKPESIEAVGGSGFAPNFVGKGVPAPKLSTSAKPVKFGNGILIPYTHFSVCMSKPRKFAYFVAWNIDGDKLKKLPRKSLKFRIDQRIDEDLQIGDELYADNKLDRGHIARRADLVWGSLAEAKQANFDSFYFTNITPQHQAFNQSERHGLWGELENAIYEDVEVEALRLSLIGGPIFTKTDPEYRDVRLPRSFWKVIAYVDHADGKLKSKAYVLTQDNLLDDLEALELDPFRLYQVSLDELEHRTDVRFGDLKKSDTFKKATNGPESLSKNDVREVSSRKDLIVG